ncbi:MAG: hypothetical protein AB8B51_17720 [Sedimentitalea sp.]
MRFFILLGLFWAQSAIAQSAFATFDRASEAFLSDPHDLAIGPDGHLYVADKFANRIVILDSETLEIVGVVQDGGLPNVHDISFAADGRAFVAVTAAHSVAEMVFENDAWAVTDVLRPFYNTEGVLAHSNGRTYVMASGTGEVIMMNGRDLLGVAPGFPGAHDVIEGRDGSIWVADTRRARLVQLSPELEQIKVIDGLGMIGPRYMDTDAAGRLVVADQDGHRILLIDPDTGALLGTLGDGLPGIGPGKFDDPEGVAVSGNRYYFADSDNNRIVKYVVVLN